MFKHWREWLIITSTTGRANLGSLMLFGCLKTQLTFSTAINLHPHTRSIRCNNPGLWVHSHIASGNRPCEGVFVSGILVCGTSNDGLV